MCSAAHLHKISDDHAAAIYKSCSPAVPMLIDHQLHPYREPTRNRSRGSAERNIALTLALVLASKAQCE